MIKALYVDDEESLLELSKIYLERDKRISEVVTCKDAEDALLLFENDGFDVIISDYEMPGMDGIGLLKELRSRGHDTPFILFTGRGREDVAIEAMDNGADFYIQKGGDPRSQFAELTHKMHASVDRWRRLKEVEGFSEIVNRMKTGLAVFDVVDPEDLESAVLANMNSAAASLSKEMGMGEVRILGEMLELLPEHNKGDMVKFFREFLNNGGSHSMEGIETVTADGQRRFFDLELIINEKGQLGFLFQEVTAKEMHRIEEEEAERRAELQRGYAIGLVMDEKVSSGVLPDAFHLMTKAICEALEATRCCIWMIDEEKGCLECESAYDRPSAEHVPPPVADLDLIRPYLGLLKAHNMIKIEDLAEGKVSGGLQNGCVVSREARSILDMGLVSDGILRGFIHVEDCEGPRSWHNDEEAFLGNMVALGGQILMAYDLHRALSASRRIEENLSLALESSNIGMWETDLVNGEFKFHESWANMLGYTPDELEPLSLEAWDRLCHPDDLAESYHEFEELIDGKKNLDGYVARLRRKDGRWAWLRCCGRAVERDQEGRPTRVIGTDIDITKEKEAELELQHSYDMLSYIVENAMSAIAVHDRELNYLFVSKGYKRQFKVEGDIIGKHHYEVFPGLPQKLREVHQRCLQGAVESREVDSFEHPDGSVDWTRWECRPWYDKDGDIGGIMVNTEVITERLEEQERLRRTEELFKILSENTTDDITVLDMDLNTVFSTMYLESIRGYRPEEMIGKHISEIFTPDSYEQVLNTLHKALEDVSEGNIAPEKTFTLELEEFHKDGHTIWAEVHARFIPDENGRPDGIIAVSRDISERKEAERKLIESEKNLRTLIEASNTGAWEFSTDDGAVWCSKEYFGILGYPAEETVGSMDKLWLDLVHPDDRDAAAKRFLAYVEGRSTSLYESEFRMRRSDGSYASILARGRRLADEGGLPGNRVVGAHIDISTQTEAFETMLEAKRRLTDIIDNLPDPTMVVSREGTVWYWNRAMEEFTGIAAAEMLDKGGHEYSVPFYGERRPILADLVLTPDPEAERLYENIERRGDTLIVDDAKVMIGGEQLRLWAMARPLYDGSGNVIGAIETVRDVTASKMAEEALRIANRQLTLLTGLTRHDVLNQTLTLGGFLQLMLEDPAMRTDEIIESLMAATDKIRKHIDFTKLYDDAGSQKPSWQRLEDMVPPENEFGHLRLETGIEGIELYADSMLPMVIHNLLDNTLRHGKDASTVRLHHRMTDGRLDIIWEDDGAGIPAEDKGRIFQRGHGSNTGMGLFMVKDILSITGLDIEETGAPGEGARFEIRVPPGRYRLRE